MFYNARYYDPKLSRFISADPIAPMRGLPQTRNRYAYTLNNPLTYTDPTGYCTETPTGTDGYRENEKCSAYAGELSRHGVILDNIYDWVSSELSLMLEAVRDFRRAANWSIEEFKAAMGGYVVMVRNYYTNPDAGRYQNWGVIDLYDNTFSNGEDFAKYLIVHELAHRWDEASGGRLSAGLMKVTGGSDQRWNCWSPYACYQAGDQSGRPFENDYYKGTRYEDFAESVAAVVYPTIDTNSASGPVKVKPDFNGSKRQKYVRSNF